MKHIDTNALLSSLQTDGEFLRAARQWTGSFAFDDGTTSLRIAVAAGRPESVALLPSGSAAGVVFFGPPDGWDKVFSPAPPPYYQDLVGGAVGRHGFGVVGNFAEMSAYHGAIHRAVQLTAQERHSEVTK